MPAWNICDQILTCYTEKKKFRKSLKIQANIYKWPFVFCSPSFIDCLCSEILFFFFKLICCFCLAVTGACQQGLLQPISSPTFRSPELWAPKPSGEAEVDPLTFSNLLFPLPLYRWALTQHKCKKKNHFLKKEPIWLTCWVRTIVVFCLFPDNS